MASHFKTLKEAKAEFKKRTGVDFKDRHTTLNPTKLFNRNKGRKRKKLKPLVKPFFIGSEFEWLNL